MDHELVGLNGPGGTTGHGGPPPWRPVAALPYALASFAIALLPIRPGWLWTILIAALAVAPWVMGRIRAARPVSYWRLSPDGLEHLRRDGTVLARYERERIEELALTDDDGVLTLFHKFGHTEVGRLEEMGFEPLPFFLTARRVGIPIHVVDGDRDTLDEDDAPPPGNDAERALLDQEAELLAAAHDPADPRGEPVRLESRPPVPGRARTALVGVMLAVLAAAMVGRIAMDGSAGFGGRLAAGCWALVGTVSAVIARRRLLRTVPVHWVVSAQTLTARVGRRRSQEVRSTDVSAIMLGPGLEVDPITGRNAEAALSALVFDHRLQLLTRLPARGLDAFQLAHVLDDHGYQVLTPDSRVLRPSEYGLEGLPEIFAQVPGGRLVVVDDGLGWADAVGDVVLKMPSDRIGGVELLTIDGHAWLRVYDSDGDEFFAAPLSALRISRTDLRESARRAGLPITDAEYDAYLSAAFHGTVFGLSVVPAAGPAGRPASAAGPTSSEGPGALLDVTPRSRLWGFVMTVAVCEVVAVLGAMWLATDLGGFGPALAWSAPIGLLLGFGGAWLYDRNRSQLRISALEIASVTRLGRVEWSLGRETVGGVGIDESEDGLPRLVIWSPGGRVLRRVSFPPDLVELRRACERYGLPWGPPDAGLPTPPPPEL